MTHEVELRRIDSGPAPGARPIGILLELDAISSRRSRGVLAGVREVMKAVLSNIDPWPDLDGWRNVLPAWFVERSAPEQTKEEAERWLASWRKLPPEEQAKAEERGWSLSNWLYWLEPEQRQWYWWDGRVIDQDTVRIVIDARDIPTALGALVWLLKAAGAERVAEANRAA